MLHSRTNFDAIPNFLESIGGLITQSAIYVGGYAKDNITKLSNIDIDLRAKAREAKLGEEWENIKKTWGDLRHVTAHNSEAAANYAMPYDDGIAAYRMLRGADLVCMGVSGGLLLTVVSRFSVTTAFVGAAGLYLTISIVTKSLTKQEYISHDLERLIQTIAAHAVLVAALAMFSSTNLDVITRRIFGIHSYKAGVVDSHRILDEIGKVHVLSVFRTPERIISQSIGMALVGQGSVTAMNTVSNLMVYHALRDPHQKQHHYVALRTVGQMAALFIEVGGPYLFYTYVSHIHYTGFVFRGAACAFRGFVDDVTENMPKNQNDWGNVAFRTVLAGSLGAVIGIPLHMIGQSNVFTAMLLATAVGAIDTVTKQFILPALSDCGMTSGEKIDLACTAILLSACFGFTINAALMAPTPSGYVSLASGFAPILPGITSFLFFLIAMPLLERLKKEKRIGDNTALLADMLIYGVMILSAFNIVLGSGAYKVVAHWLDTMALQSPVLASMLEWHQTMFGAHIMHNAALAFCLSIVLVGMTGLYQRLYQSIDNNDIRNAGELKPFIIVQALTRFCWEMIKYSIRGLLGFTLFAHAISGFVTGVIRDFAQRLIDPNRAEKLPALFTFKGFLESMSLGVRVMFDQVGYVLVDGAIPPELHPLLYLLATTGLIELPEELLHELLKSKIDIVGELKDRAVKCAGEIKDCVVTSFSEITQNLGYSNNKKVGEGYEKV